MNQEMMVNEEKQQIDYFDQLPDAILLIILNKIYDARSLCRCLAVSKRFATLIPEIGSVSITMNNNNPKLKKPIEEGSKSRNGSKSFFKNFVSKFLTKPFNFMQQMILLNNKKLLNSSSSSNNFGSGVDIFNWVDKVLKNFSEVESINLELPCHGGEIGINKNMPLLKWEAGFGKGMEGCVILGATAILQSKDGASRERNCENDDEPIFSDEELRLRIIWIISCLIASSGRHNLMKKILNQCPKLSNAVVSDAGKQGKLYMNSAQIQELRDSVDSVDSVSIESTTRINQEAAAAAAAETTTSQMGYVGNLVMKLWYVKELELPSNGQVMEGATLVVIKPENKVNGGVDKGKECDGASMWGGFEGDSVFEEASKELLKRKEKRVYRLEVNSF
ncbi:F-box protein At1g30200-like [Silene latifolia]|uniref:F-box protein At1g30200-like n=1 Tax=Silene latifolia TaxID=37657 RepID=UPI003D785E5F